MLGPPDGRGVGVGPVLGALPHPTCLLSHPDGGQSDGQTSSEGDDLVQAGDDGSGTGQPVGRRETAVIVLASRMRPAVRSRVLMTRTPLRSSDGRRWRGRVGRSGGWRGRYRPAVPRCAGRRSAPGAQVRDEVVDVGVGDQPARNRTGRREPGSMANPMPAWSGSPGISSASAPRSRAPSPRAMSTWDGGGDAEADAGGRTGRGRRRRPWWVPARTPATA